MGSRGCVIAAIVANVELECLGFVMEYSIEGLFETYTILFDCAMKSHVAPSFDECSRYNHELRHSSLVVGRSISIGHLATCGSCDSTGIVAVGVRSSVAGRVVESLMPIGRR